MPTTKDWPHILTTRYALSRRGFLRGSALGVGGLATAALLGCGDDEGEPADTDTAATGTATRDELGEDEEVIAARGELIEAPGLPYPYNYPEPDIPPTPGGVLRTATTWDPSNLDPTTSAAGGTITIPNVVYNRLIGIVGGVDVDPRLIELEPELAGSWETSPDGLTHTFNIRGDITWQNVPPLDGRQFTAEDAAYALNRYASEGAQVHLFANAEAIEAVDDGTLRITLNRPINDFINPLGSRWLPIFPRETVENGTIESTVIGTGPMIARQIEQAGTQVFEKNPDYWERAVLLDGFEIQVMLDSSARLGAFRAGQIGEGYGIATRLSDIQRIAEELDAQVNAVPASPGVGHANFGMNLANPKFQDERIRRAISLSIDRESLIQILFEGAAVSHPSYPWFFAVDEEPTLEDLGPWVRYDPGEAQQLLQAAGQPDFVINSIYYRYDDTYTSVAEVLTDMMRESGITLNSASVDYTEFNSQWTTGSLPEASTSAWGAPGFSASNYYYDQVHSESPGNRWNINDPQVDEWAEAQQVELDPEARREIFRQMWDYELDVVYRPPLVNAIGFSILAPWLRGIRFGGALGTNSSFYDWGDQIAEAWINR